MRNGLLICVLAILSTSLLEAQVKGEGPVVKQEIQLEAIHGIALSFDGDVYLSQGPQQITLEGQQNVLNNIKREVRDGIWYLKYDHRVHDTKQVKIYVTMPSLTDIALSGSGSVSSTNTFQDLEDVDIALSGSGKISLDLKARKVETGTSGSGDIALRGSADKVEIAISGSGSVDAGDLESSECEVAISGSGDVTVNCSDVLDSSVSGSGDVRYKGKAPVIRSSVSGSGEIREVD